MVESEPNQQHEGSKAGSIIVDNDDLRPFSEIKAKIEDVID